MTAFADALREAARAALPPLDGDVRIPGIGGPVEVIRDGWGVPHISAGSVEDLCAAQGYVVASERLFQIELTLRVGAGRLSEVFGELALPIDRFVRTVGWNRAAAAVAAGWSDRSRELCLAHMRGVRAWVHTMAAPPVEYAVLGAEPWIPEDDDAALVAAGGAMVFMAWSLSRAWDNDLLRAEVLERFGPEMLATLFPDQPADPAVVRASKDVHPDALRVLRDAFLPPSGQGSNNWVVSGRRTTSGKPLLANDPHLVAQLPSAWFECHLSAPGVDVAGVALPFAPLVVVGHNDRIAWGLTNSEGDVQDLYLERLSADGRSAEHLGRWEPLTAHREEIAVRGRETPEVLEVRETRHGPLLTGYMVGIGDPQVVEGGIGHDYALRWVGAERIIELAALEGLATARGWDDFRDALRRWWCPGQNAVYADVDGNIGMQVCGTYPVRAGGRGALPAPGWTDAYEWVGDVPFDELPRAFNPDDGFLVTANNRLYDDAYPHHLGDDFLPPFRARRIAERLTRERRHTTATFAEIQRCTYSIPAARIVPLLLEVEPSTERQRQALAILAEWDHDLGPGSAAAAIYEVWTVRASRRILLPVLGERLFEHYYGRRQWTNGFHYGVLPHVLAHPTARWFGEDGRGARDRLLLDALAEALDELTARLGEDMASWRWGALHRLRFAGRLAAIPDLAELFTAGDVEMGGDEQTVNQTLFEPGAGYEPVVVPSWRQIIDLADLDASVGAHAPGQSGNPVSPHFDDQLALWAAGEHHPMPFSREAVEAARAHTLVLLPAE